MDCVEVIRHEAWLTCNYGTWSSLIHLFALSSAMGCNILSMYPEGVSEAIRPLFSGIIEPARKQERLFYLKVPLAVIWSRDGDFDATPGAPFQPNHFAAAKQIFVSFDEIERSEDAYVADDLLMNAVDEVECQLLLSPTTKTEQAEEGMSDEQRETNGEGTAATDAKDDKFDIEENSNTDVTGRQESHNKDVRDNEDANQSKDRITDEERETNGEGTAAKMINLILRRTAILTSQADRSRTTRTSEITRMQISPRTE